MYPLTTQSENTLTTLLSELKFAKEVLEDITPKNKEKQNAK